MRKIFIILSFITAIMGYAQMEKTVTRLPEFCAVNGDKYHTIKVEVTNTEDRCNLLYLTNDQELTGIDLSGAVWKYPNSFLSEYVNLMDLDHDKWIPTPFSLWFKSLDPGATFTFYFQSKNEIDVERLLGLIKFSKGRYCEMPKVMEDLAWKPDEIVIFLPLRESSAEDNTTP